MAYLQYLIPFIQVVRCGSFTSAADKLGVTPPAVSKSIALLENELGMRLINRTTRQLHLTNEGRDFYEKTSALIEGLDGAVENAKSTMDEPGGAVRVAVGANFGRYCLIPILADFFIQYPKVNLEIEFEDGPKDSLERGFDLEICNGQGSKTSYVSRLLLADFPFVMVASPLYLANCGVPRSIKDLSQHNYIVTSLNRSELANWKIVRNNSLPLNTSNRKNKKEIASMPHTGRLTMVTHHDTSLISALHGIGITPSALPVAMPFLQSGRLKVVLPDYRIKHISSPDSHNQMFIQYPHREHLAPKVRVFVEYLLEKFRSSESATEDISKYAA